MDNHVGIILATNASGCCVANYPHEGGMTLPPRRLMIRIYFLPGNDNIVEEQEYKTDEQTFT